MVADDTIPISAANFGSGLIPGAPLEIDQFVIGATANDTSDRFIYDATNGTLFFDLDGIGKNGQQQIATQPKSITHNSVRIAIPAYRCFL